MKTYSRHDFTREERAARAKVAISAAFESEEQAFLDFVLSHYVRVGVQELDQEKLTPLLRLKYNNSIADAVAHLGKPEVANSYRVFRRCRSPSGTIRFRHSSFTDRTNRSAYALQFGAQGGVRTTHALRPLPATARHPAPLRIAIAQQNPSVGQQSRLSSRLP